MQMQTEGGLLFRGPLCTHARTHTHTHTPLATVSDSGGRFPLNAFNWVGFVMDIPFSLAVRYCVCKYCLLPQFQLGDGKGDCPLISGPFSFLRSMSSNRQSL